PFNTNAGYGIGSSFDTVKQLCPEAKVLDGFSTKGGKEKEGILFVLNGNRQNKVKLEVHNWLKEIEFVH
ncbi:MAG: flavodoxin, partial [Sphingobacterium sp.]